MLRMLPNISLCVSSRNSNVNQVPGTETCVIVLDFPLFPEQETRSGVHLSFMCNGKKAIKGEYASHI